MYATIRNNHYRKVIEQFRHFYTFHVWHINVQRGCVEDALF